MNINYKAFGLVLDNGESFTYQDLENPQVKQILERLLKKKATNSEISEALNIIPQNTSSYLKELKNKDFIALEKKEKTKKIYIAKFKAIWLKFSIDGGVQQSLSEYYA